MNVIELAREADLTFMGADAHCREDYFTATREELERFAALVRAEVLEEAADICDRVNNYDNPMTAGDCADAIRALKEKT